MNEYYRDQFAIVYNNDFADIIDKLKFDYIITDPPYNINYDYNDYNDLMPENNYVNMLSRLNKYKTIMIHYPERFMGDVGLAMGRPNKVCQWCYNSNISKNHRSICWFNCNPDLTKVKQPYKNPKDKRIIQAIANGSKGAKLYDWWNDIPYINNVSREKVKNFSNQIPIKLLERLLLISTNEGDTILDPFFGTGSLYFACKNTNRKCIGIEKSIYHLQLFSTRL